MGREQRRKEEKNNKRIVKNEEQLDTSIKMSTLIKIIVAITIILVLLYYILAVFITKELDVTGNKDASTSNTSTNNVPNAILASSIFNQAEETYYVYFYNFTEEDENVGSAINSNSSKTIYRVNTNDGLNSKYITLEQGNKSVTSLENLKVKDPTLIEITNDKVTKYFEGSTSIINFLSE